MNHSEVNPANWQLSHFWEGDWVVMVICLVDKYADLRPSGGFITARHSHSGTNQLIVGSTIPHVVTDVVLLGIPVPLIWNLHLHISRKVILTAIFAFIMLYIAPLFMSFYKCTARAGAKTSFPR